MPSNQELMVGIFAADTGVAGELRYAAKKLTGQTSCSLCDITHGWNPKGRPEWKKACAEAGMELKLVHRNHATKSQLETAGALPVVLVGSENEWRVLLDDQALKELAGSPGLLVERLQKLA